MTCEKSCFQYVTQPEKWIQFDIKWFAERNIIQLVFIPHQQLYSFR